MNPLGTMETGIFRPFWTRSFTFKSTRIVPLATFRVAQLSLLLFTFFTPHRTSGTSIYRIEPTIHTIIAHTRGTRTLCGGAFRFFRIRRRGCECPDKFPSDHLTKYQLGGSLSRPRSTIIILKLQTISTTVFACEITQSTIVVILYAKITWIYRW